MKKIYTLLAIAALMVCAASCGNNAKKAEEEPAAAPQAEAAAPEKSAADQIKEAATNAAVDVATTGINAAAQAAKDATK